MRYSWFDLVLYLFAIVLLIPLVMRLVESIIAICPWTASIDNVTMFKKLQRLQPLLPRLGLGTGGQRRRPTMTARSREAGSCRETRAWKAS